MLTITRSTVFTLSLVVLGGAASELRGAEAETPANQVSPAEHQRVVDSAIRYILSRAAAQDGALSKQSGIGVTSVAVAGVLANRPDAVDEPALRKSIEFILSNVRADGGIYSEGSLHRNYETALAIQALVKANRDGRHDVTLTKAEAFLKGLQWDAGEGIETSDPRYGGAGYGSHSRPDLSNTAFMIEALHELGRGADDEAIQKALIFVSRTQNLESPANTTEFAAKVDDGGFYYTPAAGGSSQAGQTPSGGLRSYGSMTYAGLKSMLYAGVDKDDPRVKAAMDFIGQHYTLEQNPGMGAAGLYYYYHTFAKAMDAAGSDILTDASGTEHHWRGDLFRTLAAAQTEDGSWVNEQNPRWMEGDRELVTGYVLLALPYTKPQ